MSYSSEVKNQLISALPSNICCRHSMLSAIIKVDGSLHLNGKNISLETHTENSAVARFIKKELANFGLKASVAVRRSVLKGHTNYAVTLSPQKNLLSVLIELGIFDAEKHLLYGAPKNLVKNSCCKQAYLKGIFLGAGYIADPNQNYHLELDIENNWLSKDLVYFLKHFNLNAHISEKKQGYILYFKKFDDICGFFALIGATRIVLNFNDTKIIKEIKNTVNRLVNCETANVKKVINAAQKQIKDIAVIDENFGIENLTPSLQEVIGLRVKNPQASLVELTNKADHPLTKSAINHRFRRISEMAKNFL